MICVCTIKYEITGILDHHEVLQSLRIIVEGNSIRTFRFFLYSGKLEQC